MYVPVDVLEDAPDTYYMVAGFGQGYSGIQRRDPPWIIFSAWDYGCVEGAATQPSGCKRAQVDALGPQTRSAGFGGEGTGAKTYIVKEWDSTRTHALLIAASRNRGDSSGRDCKASAYYRSESKTNLADVDPWLFVATLSFGCNSHPLQGSSPYRWGSRTHPTHSAARMKDSHARVCHL